MLLAVALLLPYSASAQVRIYASGGKSVTTWHGQADLQAMHIELGYALSSRTTVAVAVSPMILRQPRSFFGDQYGDGNESVRALGSSLLLRRSFRVSAPVQWYLEGGTGPMIADKRSPAATSRFNFVTQGGAGFVFNAQGRLPVIAGYRFMHISNGGYSPRNHGWNMSAAVLGVQLRSATTRRR